ncbi:unnamed protein product [Diplocarpon coronariae]
MKALSSEHGIRAEALGAHRSRGDRNRHRTTIPHCQPSGFRVSGAAVQRRLATHPLIMPVPSPSFPWTFEAHECQSTSSQARVTVTTLVASVAWAVCKAQIYFACGVDPAGAQIDRVPTSYVCRPRSLPSVLATEFFICFALLCSLCRPVLRSGCRAHIFVSGAAPGPEQVRDAIMMLTMLTMMQSARSFQKTAAVLILVLTSSLLYLYRASSLSLQHQLPHGSVRHTPHSVARARSIKPIAYVFPQYYPFAENDKLHGENFTEWVNVKRVTHNSWGLETIRPHESIGFYDGLEFKTRQRQGKFLRENGFYGVAFHHYWFAGKPVMDHVVQAMLQDGEPNIPFMLSWANEPWTARWDGLEAKGSVLIAQSYGLQAAWRKHFDWLLPFFKHPQYIRSNGKIQFLVYNPAHIGHLGPQMYASWRRWAVEEGLGGMDIIETRWGEGSMETPKSWQGYPPDAVNEFAPHAGGPDRMKYSSLKRLSQAYHRGTHACWDTTPRHPTDGKASSLPTCHPRTWQNHLVEMFRKIKSDPNPLGSENFFFVNALNEWGEGNAIEPSVQFGYGYANAMKNAIAISEKEHVWADVSIESNLARDRELAILMRNKADVCVVVRAGPQNAEDKIFKLSAMLRSLQAQQNTNWRAVVLPKGDSEFPDLNLLVLQSLDARIKVSDVPTDEKTTTIPTSDGDGRGFLATDWVIQNLARLDLGCQSARYLLITDGSNIYEPTAFDSLSETEDLIALNVESRESLWNHPMSQRNISWADRCRRLEDPQLKLCGISAPKRASFDLSATLINFRKLQVEGLSFSRLNKNIPHRHDSAIAEVLIRNRGWKLAPSQSAECHVRHNPAYTSCLKTGGFWFDSPIYEEMGCYSTISLIEQMGPKTPNLEGIDLKYFRKHGHCVKSWHVACTTPMPKRLDGPNMVVAIWAARTIIARPLACGLLGLCEVESGSRSGTGRLEDR